MIELREVAKRYPGGLEALAGVSLSIERGAMAFLTGRSGAGKSTLLRLLSLVEKASGGAVLVGGQDLAALRAADVPAYRRALGLVFQDHRLLADRSVFDNVALPLEVAGYAHREIPRRVRAALDLVGLLARERIEPVRLSAGEQQRVGIARAVVHRPVLLLADEPTGNLDPGLSREVMQLFERLNQTGTTVLIASHDLALVAEMGYDEVRLDAGRLVSVGRRNGQ